MDKNLKNALLPTPRKPRSTSLPRRQTSGTLRSTSKFSIASKDKRSKSVDNGKIDSKYLSNSLVSILKKQNSPRNSNRNVKFDVVNIKEEHVAEVNENKKIQNLDWIMTAKYQKDKIIPLKSLEETDKKTKDDFNQKEFNRFKKEYKKLEGLNNPYLNAEHNKRDSNESLKSNKDNDINDKMFVFECNRWLAKDEGDGRIERILKLSKIISNH